MGLTKTPKRYIKKSKIKSRVSSKVKKAKRINLETRF
jgi:hypothetical protein